MNAVTIADGFVIFKGACLVRGPCSSPLEVSVDRYIESQAKEDRDTRGKLGDWDVSKILKVELALLL
jgi:hypothetical protein